LSILGTYSAQNAMGAERIVTKLKKDTFELLFNNPQDFGFKVDRLTGMEERMEFEIPMDAPTAMAAKPNLRMLIVYQVEHPYVGYYENHVRPEVNDPEERLLQWYYLNSKVREFWFYNSETGEVYRKVKSKRR
jgi:hypothetical protein